MKTVVQVDPQAINNVITSAKVRRIIYTVITLASVLIGAIGVAYGANAPEWYEITVRVYLFIAAASGGLALTNTPAKKNQEEVIVEGEETQTDVDPGNYVI